MPFSSYKFITMKKILCFVFLSGLFAINVNAQDTQKKASPLVKVSEKIASGATVTIEYSQPSVKGRTIGKDLEPLEGKIWRTGANDATTFTTDKDVTIDGQTLPAGKYALFTLFEGDNVTVIFNKTWKQWGAFNYKQDEDALRIKTKATGAATASEKLNITLDANGVVTLLWGNKSVSFTVK